MTISDVIAFAKEQGYQTAEYLREWNGYHCYEPIYNSDDVSFIGLPLVIMVKDNEIRMSTPDEAMQI